MHFEILTWSAMRYTKSRAALMPARGSSHVDYAPTIASAATIVVLRARATTGKVATKHGDEPFHRLCPDADIGVPLLAQPAVRMMPSPCGMSFRSHSILNE
jgi:hypothetical protein